MTRAEFLATIAAHPVAKHWRFFATESALTVNFGDACQVHRGSGGRDWICHKGVVGIASGTQTYHPTLTAALDAALAIIEPPKPKVPRGFVAVDVPTIGDCDKDTRAGEFFLCMNENGKLHFHPPDQPVNTWLDFDRAGAERKGWTDARTAACHALQAELTSFYTSGVARRAVDIVAALKKPEPTP